MSEKKVKILKGQYKFKRFPTREYVDFTSHFDWKKIKGEKSEIRKYLEKCNDLYHTILVAIEKKAIVQAAEACETYICYISRLMKQSKNGVIQQSRDSVWAPAWTSFITEEPQSYRSTNFYFEISMSCILLACLHYSISVEMSEGSRKSEKKAQTENLEKAGWIFLYASTYLIKDDASLAPEYNTKFCKEMSDFCFAQSIVIKAKVFMTAQNSNLDLISKMTSFCYKRFDSVHSYLKSISFSVNKNNSGKPKIDSNFILFVEFRTISIKSSCLAICGMKYEKEKKHFSSAKFYQVAFDMIEEICSQYFIGINEESPKGTIGRQGFYTKKLLDSASNIYQVSSEKETVVVRIPEEKSGIASEKWAIPNDQNIWPK